MILILTALLLAGFFAVVLFGYSENGYAIRHAFAGVFGLVLLLCTTAGLLFYAYGGYLWVAAGHKVQIINREYHTTYTQEEIFYASSVIDIIRQLDRSRYEVNGNIMKDKDKEK